MKRWLIAILLLLSSTSVQAQVGDNLPPITPENAAQVTQLGSVGRGEVIDLSWSPDARTLALATRAGIWLYDPADLAASPRTLTAELGPVIRLAFSPNSATVAVLTSLFQDGGSAIQWWNVATGELQATWTDQQAFARNIAFTSDGTLLAAAYYKDASPLNILRFSSTDEPTAELQTTINPQIEVRDMEFSTDAAALIIGGGPISGSHYTVPVENYYTHIFSTQTGQEASLLKTEHLVEHVTLGRSLAATAYGAIEIFDVRTTGKTADIVGGHGPLALSSTEALLAYTTQTVPDRETAFYYDSQLNLLDLRTGVSKPLMPAATEVISALAFNSDSSILAGVSYDDRGVESIRLFDTISGSLISSLPSTWPVSVESITLTPDDRSLAFNSQRGLWVWELSASAPELSILQADLHAARAFSPDGEWLAAVLVDGVSVGIWHLDALQPLVTIPTEMDRITQLAFSPEENWLAASGYTLDQNKDYETTLFELWDTSTWTSQVISEGGYNLFFSPRGDFLATTDRMGVWLWDLKSQELIGPLEGDFAQEDYSVLFSPDGSRLLYGRGEYRAMLDLQTGTDRYTIEGRWGEVFSPDGSLIAIQGIYDAEFEGARVVLTEAASGKQVAVLEVPGADYFTDIIFSPDGWWIIATEMSGRTTAWDLTTLQQVAQLDNPVVFNTVGTVAAGITPDGCIDLWDTMTWRAHRLTPCVHRQTSPVWFNQDGTLLFMLSDSAVLRWWGVG